MCGDTPGVEPTPRRLHRASSDRQAAHDGTHDHLHRATVAILAAAPAFVVRLWGAVGDPANIAAAALLALAGVSGAVR